MTAECIDLERTAVTTGELLPGYEMVRVLGTGGFGTVVEARQLKLDRVVAIKIIDLDKLANPALANRFQSEAITLARFHHPNIVQVHDFTIDGGRIFIAMELLEGEDLGRRIRSVGRLDERIAWAIARQTAAALGHAASQGVVHRDIKPTNLFLIPAPTGIGLPRDVPMVKVMDFGLAMTKWAVDEMSERLTAHGAVLGTPVYMAPEQYHGAAEVDLRADIYSLGATVFHCLAGRAPFEGPTIWDVMRQKFDGPPVQWPEISPDSMALLQAMLAPDSRDRIASYEELLHRIDALPALEPSSAKTFLPAAFEGDNAHRAPRGRWAWPRWRYIAASAVAVVATTTIAMLRAPTSTTAAGASPPPSYARYIARGPHQALFNNESMAGWFLPAAGGVWQLEADDEQATVLSGSGFIRRSFQAPTDYRVTLGFDLHKATRAEFHFALRIVAGDSSPRLVVRISRNEGATLGVKTGDRGEFRALAPAHPFPSPDWFDGRRPYIEVRIQRATGIWSASFNGDWIGRWADDGSPKSPEIRLNAEGGRAHVDSVILEGLQKAP